MLTPLMADKSTRKDFHVAIIGAGMCGLAAAYALTRAGISVQVFESAPKLGEVGAGVGLGKGITTTTYLMAYIPGPNALRALRGLGLFEAVRARSEEPEVFRALKFTSGYGNHEVVYDPSDAGMGLYRPAFIEVVEALLDPDIILLNKRCTAVEMFETHTVVHFADGSSYPADLVVGADGIKSTVRNVVTGNQQPVFMNTIAYRGLVRNDDLVKDGVQIDYTGRPICFVGMDRHIITFPIKSGEIINIVAFDSQRSIPKGSMHIPLERWVEPATKNELTDKFKGWGRDVLIILSHLRNPNKWYVHGILPPIENYVRKNVVLVGDSAHAMEPHLGAGVGQGFEDVLVLCKLLGHEKTSKANLEDVLQIYNKMRPPRVNTVLLKSSMAGEIYESYGKYSKEEMQQRLNGIWGPVWHHDLDKELADITNESHVFQ